MSNAQSQGIDKLLDSETGSRDASKLVVAILVTWSCFQLLYASPVFLQLMNSIGFGFNENIARYIHLAFAGMLVYFLFPARRFKFVNIFLGLAIAGSALYLIIFREQLNHRSGDFIIQDVIAGGIGMLLLLEATRRSLGLPLVVVSLVFLAYTLFGQYMPDAISHKGHDFSKIIGHQWLTTEGVFGVALGVSTSFVFLFVLLGAFLDKAGAGNYLIKVSFAFLGHLRGGPGKAAVVASGLSGIISGSSISNVVTTGTFTIPLMKRVGFPGTKAGAVEVAASTNGQLTPPIMGAAAFLMVEYVGISYMEVVKHAILPSLISYVALVYIVHLEAMKLNMQGVTKSDMPTIAQRMLIWCSNIIILLVLAAVIYFGSTILESVFSESLGVAYSVMALAALLLYLGLVKLAAAYPDLAEDDQSVNLDSLPEAKSTTLSGLYFVVPIVILLWGLAVQRYSPELSAFYSVMSLILVVFTHRPLKAMFRGQSSDIIAKNFRQGCSDFYQAMVSGARNMIGIAVATAAAGIIVGTVTLTGLGQYMTEFVEFISQGNLMLILIFTAVICIILGMGLPTTANYIVVSTLMAPVIVSLGAENGLVVPLIAVHLFVFYFGILADDTPPVGLAAFAAAAISGADPIRTGIQGFTYDMRTAVLPFMFIFNTNLLLIGVDFTSIQGIFFLLLTIFSALVAILVFSAATQGFWIVRTKWWETLFLLLVAFSMFRPDFWWDRVYPPVQNLPSAEVMAKIDAMNANDFIKLNVSGETLEGKSIAKTVSLTLEEGGANGNAKERLQSMGLIVVPGDDKLIVDTVQFGSQAEKLGVDFGWNIDGVQVPNPRPPQELVFIPTLFVLFLIYWSQRTRRRRELKLSLA